VLRTSESGVNLVFGLVALGGTGASSCLERIRAVPTCSLRGAGGIDSSFVPVERLPVGPPGSQRANEPFDTPVLAGPMRLH